MHIPTGGPNFVRTLLASLIIIQGFLRAFAQFKLIVKRQHSNAVWNFRQQCKKHEWKMTSDQATPINQKKPSLCSESEDQLMIDLFRGYNSLIRPVRSENGTAVSESIEVRFGLQLVLLINVDEKNQIMHTNVWLTLKWHDFQMRWNPVQYGGIQQIRVAPDKVWLPDIVLFNNADGVYEVSFFCNVVVEFNGNMLWVPPAIYKSSCIIDVEFFPFDEQTCSMIFGSWTYNQHEVILGFNDNAEMVDINEYYASSIWDVIEVPAELVKQKSRIEYRIKLRRKTLFYTVVLIIPTVLMAFLSMMVFYLPAGAGEKITLTISVLLSLVVFLLLVSKILPPTSSTIPLMAKYLLLTFVLNIVTILVTVIILNVYFRGPATHRMPPWVSRTFLEFLPKLLMMKRPKPTRRRIAGSNGVLPGSSSMMKEEDGRRVLVPAPMLGGAPAVVLQSYPTYHFRQTSPARELITSSSPGSTTNPGYPLTPEACRAIEAIEYITEHLRQDEEYKRLREDWKYVAMVIDRLLLYIFLGVTLGGTLGILLSAPNVFQFVDQKIIIDRLKAIYKGEAELDET